MNVYFFERHFKCVEYIYNKKKFMNLISLSELMIFGDLYAVCPLSKNGHLPNHIDTFIKN